MRFGISFAQYAYDLVDSNDEKMKRDGFTIAELMSVLGVACIMAAIAIPSFITWLPNVRLKGAARELYSNMQLAKTRAMKTNSDWAIVFDISATPGTYSVCSGAGANGTWEGPGGDDAVVKTVQLSDYSGSVDYGPGSAGSARRVAGRLRMGR